MSVRGFNKYGVTGPRGPWSRLDNRPVPIERGSLAQNVRFETNRVKTRDGFGADFSVSGKVTTIYHWITNDTGIEINRVIFKDGDDVKMRDMVSLVTQTLFTQSGGRSAPPAEGGSRLYIPVNTTAGIAASQLRIVNALLGGVPADFAFAAPMVIAPTVADAGAGSVTAGDHRFGYIMESRTGFVGKPGPQPSGVFTPVTATVAAGGRTLTLTVNGTMPDDAAYLHPIMTRIDNPDRWYFVPDAAVAVPGGAVWTANMTIDISDEDLANSATVVDEQFDYLTQDSGGSGPFNPFAVFEIGQRLCYLTPQKAYISDPQDYQALTEVEHTIQLPGQRQFIAGFAIRDNVYFVGPSWTYGTSDNGDRPRLWVQPELVSGGIGTLGNQCVAWKTGGDYAWIANYSGLYFFDGQYDERPVSYMVEDSWRRINWGAAYAVQVVDDFVQQRVIVAAPLDGATEPTHMLVFDYSRGFKWDQVDFSLDNLPSNFSAIGLVKNRTTGRPEMYVGPSAAGHMLRQQVDLRTDDSEAIDSLYETGLMLREGEKWKFMKMGWLELIAVGEGDLAVTVYGLDRVYDAPLGTILLTEEPGNHPLIPLDFNDENFSVRVESSTLGGWFDLSRITIMVRNWMTN